MKTCEKQVSVCYHDTSINQVGFSENGDYLITIGGVEMATIALWRVHELVSSGKGKSMLRNVHAMVEIVIDKFTIVNTLAIDYKHSDSQFLNLAVGCDTGIKFYTIKCQEKLIEEKSAMIDKSEHLKNVSGISFFENETYAGSDDGYVYVFR